MTFRSSPRSWLQLSAAAGLCAALIACGPDDPGGSSNGAGSPGSGSGGTDEFCDRLFAALEGVSDRESSVESGADLFLRAAENLRGVRPYAPESISTEFDSFIEYYEQAAAGRTSPEFAENMERYLQANNAVFGHCASQPILPLPNQ